MAGGKETPRQRLIGLMYLVLLAMLAIQVSDAIMEKFFFLEQSLVTAKSQSEILSSKSYAIVKKEADERGTDAAKDKLRKADAIRKATADVQAYIETMKTDLVKLTGGLEEEGGFYKGAKEESQVEEIYVGPSKNGKAYELKKKLDEYVKTLNGITGSNYDMIAKDGKEDPIFKKNVNQNIKDFAELNFAQTPMVAAMAVLSQKQSVISTYESEALGALAGDSKDVIKFDDIVAMYRAQSSVVAAGMDYEAEIFVSGVNKKLVPEVLYGGSKLAVVDGVAKVKFKASGGAYDKEGFAKKSWAATVNVPVNGTMRKLDVKAEYLVAKPTIDVKAGSVSALYENCGNDLNIQVPSLGANYKPSFSVQGANQQSGSGRGSVIIIPGTGSKKVTIGVSSGGTFIDKVEFGVRPVPLPTFVPTGASGPINPRVGIKTTNSYFTIKVEPEQGFAQFLPKEATYNIEEAQVAIVTGKTARATTNINSNTVRLSNFNIRNGERIVVEIKKLTRTNFRGEKVNVPLSPIMATIQVPVAD